MQSAMADIAEQPRKGTRKGNPKVRSGCVTCKSVRSRSFPKSQSQLIFYVSADIDLL